MKGLVYMNQMYNLTEWEYGKLLYICDKLDVTLEELISSSLRQVIEDYDKEKKELLEYYKNLK